MARGSDLMVSGVAAVTTRADPVATGRENGTLHPYIHTCIHVYAEGVLNIFYEDMH